MNTATLVQNKTTKMEAAALTDRGQRRALNEDAVFYHIDQTNSGQNLGLYVVCDGLGGHQAGELASHLAIKTLTEELSNILTALRLLDNNQYPLSARATVGRYLKAAVEKANQAIYHYASTHPQQAGNMGTTVTLALIYDDTAYIANVGDSRTYLWRAGHLSQLTRDHSVAAELAAIGEIDESEIADHPQNNLLLRALGTDETVEVDLYEQKIEAGDKLLLCSDGLWQAFPTGEALAEWFEVATTSIHLCRCLVADANERHGRDNISAVVVEIKSVGSPKIPEVYRQLLPTTYQSRTFAA